MEAQGWRLPPTCQGQLCPVRKGSRIPGTWHPVEHWHSEQETSLWSYEGTGLELTAQVQDPPASWPFLGGCSVRPHSPAADPRGLWPSPDPPHRWDHCLCPPPLATCSLAPPAPPRHGRREGLLGEHGFPFSASHWRYLCTPRLGSAGRDALDLEM